ncbi:hypothetical protein ASPVEDRAFT_42833 [Aspergillus versicolor CBS 583.65]|uniref:N-acetyltransferase domain-containing protein n=1 Tax=Aspergillus versicolor CBS 583.65 TaxID=1036611 RepID=A0A1L9PPF1_ASPVE|nr:uncharacterized protein ASPVEDRAFT_42833 [Aspergillus versicolor CBS 583.65]OJJ03315.1 hypothetical protein ASPVEDRAFT_42833 [Aspergillus versicolor CBS 583.65]
MTIEPIPPVPPTVARLTEAAEAAFITEQNRAAGQLYPKDGFIAQPLGTGVVAITKASFLSKLNHVAGFAMDGPVTDQDIDTIEGLFQGINLPPYIDLCPFSHPTARHLFNERGYTLDSKISVYTLPLHDYENNNTTTTTEITRVSDTEKDLFTDYSISGAKSLGRPVELLETLAKSATLRSDTRLYLAKIDGQISGSAGLAFLTTPFGQVAELYIDSTVPEFRGRGVQTALLRARLADAKAAGVERAVMYARPGEASARNAERVGFQLAYVKDRLTKV